MIAKPRGYDYAKGAFRRLAEDYGADRHGDLIDYNAHPPKWKVIEDMVDHGWSDDEAAIAVNKLFEHEFGDDYETPGKKQRHKS